MIFHPAIIALLLSSFLITFLILYSSYFGLRIVRKWDIKSGSELQLNLERRTYLISTILAYVLGFQLFSLFLYIYTADNLHSLFVGAMCAAGTLNVNAYGYPTLILKVVNFLLAGLWLILNYTDNRAYDYPLIKKKYVFLLVIALFVTAEMIIQTNYLLRLKADVITSCCGSLFSTDTRGITSEIVALPSIPMKIAFYLGMAFTFVSGICFLKNSKLTGYVFSLASAVTFIISIISLISFISLYFYDLPTHHCPFCILQREYGYIGYLLYITILGGSVLGMGVGVVMPFRDIKSLSEILPSIQRRFAIISLVLYFLFTAVVTYRIVFSDFKLEGY
ncbi:MAG: hypothetical protein QMD44_04060 [Thermodesulfovibrionales bacterium]|jgi:hypothetical protein|nr:hypothetical protein [Thermodesulfovibrionales bacterium]